MSEDILIGVADILARRWPDALARLDQLHRPGADGRCLGCASQVRLAPMWPCALAAVAIEGRLRWG